MRMYRGDYRKLTVSMPPRHSKSSLITLAFPLWLISRDPSLNIMIINSTFTLSESFGIRIRELFHQYQDQLGLRVSDKKHASGWIMFEDLQGNLTGGSIRLVGIGGQITGFDADWIIVDDLVKGVQDTTPTVLEKTRDFFNGIIMQRVEPDTRLIVLGTIWHSDDILSYLRNEHSDEYKIIDMPAYDNQGKVLWSDRYNLDFFKERKKEMGERLFQALYLCSPIDLTSNFFAIDNIRWNTTLPTDTERQCRSWDIASGDNLSQSDYTAGILAKKKGNNMYITDLQHGRYGENTKTIIKKTAMTDGVETTQLIETGVAAAGKLLYQEWRTQLKGYRVEQSTPITNKLDRATPLQNAIYDGNLVINIEDPVKREAILTELKTFPNGKHDDIIDAMSYAYNYLFRQNTKTVQLGVVYL